MTRRPSFALSSFTKKVYSFTCSLMRSAPATSPRPLPNSPPAHGPLAAARPPPVPKPPMAAKPVVQMALPAMAEGMVALKRVLEDQTRRTTNIAGLRALREGPNPKSVFLLDQYGVLHDGKVAYPCAISTVKSLHESGARLFIISNSSRRSSSTLKKLKPMGFLPEWFEGVITSGEITHNKLNSRNDLASESANGTDTEGDEETDVTGSDAMDEAFAELGDRCLHFTWSKRGAVRLDGIEGLVTVDAEDFLENSQSVGNLESLNESGAGENTDTADKTVSETAETTPEEPAPGKVDFLLAHGTECVNGAGSTDAERGAGSTDTAIEDMRVILQAAAKESLPLVVANPDLVTVGGAEGLLPMPGTLASWYSEMPGAGPIYLMGKPSLVVYEQLQLVTNATKTETVAVGDSLEHDVNGAAAYGIGTALRVSQIRHTLFPHTRR